MCNIILRLSCIKKMGNWLKFLFKKWVQKECPHFCIFCPYRAEYFDSCYCDMIFNTDIVNNKKKWELKKKKKREGRR